VLDATDSAATVAVKDLDEARGFYEGTLGLEPFFTDSEAVGYRTGSSALFVYRSEYAGSNEATAVTWIVGDQVDAIMDDLRAKGVTFEHYDLPGITRDGDVHVAGEMRGAWFKDPEGNIHSIVNGPTLGT
jgi:catechol 2,3-dioxygenase-like lactoylglutathione lyase family enzyme